MVDNLYFVSHVRWSCDNRLFYSPYSYRAWSIIVVRLVTLCFNPSNDKLNPICRLLALLGTHRIIHVSSIRVKPLSIYFYWGFDNIIFFFIFSFFSFPFCKSAVYDWIQYYCCSFCNPSLVDFWFKHQYRRQATPQENAFKTHAFITKINTLFCHPRTRLFIGSYGLLL